MNPGIEAINSDLVDEVQSIYEREKISWYILPLCFLLCKLSIHRVSYHSFNKFHVMNI